MTAPPQDPGASGAPEASDQVAGFTDRLAAALTLTIGGQAHVIPGGSVKDLQLDLRSYGFTGSLSFVVQDDAAHGGSFTDALLAEFLKPDLIELSLELSAVLVSPEAGELTPISLAGLVTDKAVSEVLFRQLSDLPVLIRRYRVSFADPAQVLWAQHFPCQLYTNKSMVDVINDHLGDKLTVTYDFSALSESQRMVFLHLPRAAGVSFWDFVSWYLDERAGVLSYDYAAASYLIAATKSEAGTPIKLFGDDLERAELCLPAVPRYAPVVLNSNADAARSEPVTQAQAATGIRSDVLLRTPIAQDVDDQVALQRKLTVVPSTQAHLWFARMPGNTLVPGALVELPAANRWSSESALVGVTWRVRGLQLRASAPSTAHDRDLQLPSTGYRVEVRAQLEAKAEAQVERPAFRRPVYPGLVEGKVVSEQGQDGEKTYQVNRDADTSLDEYHVKVPLWDNQVVSAPHEPILGSGNLYLPSYRDERVLLALEVHSAEIARLLEWRAGAPLSMDVQGQHLLFGKSDDSQTSVNHVYDGDKPVFNVARKNQSDTALIQLKEGTLFLQVKEQEQG
ncbi:MAG: hypothetical protein IPI49_28920 [Myxococcales bacterium]|nr:hypothetical protein [Myxococcales bacterium]